MKLLRTVAFGILLYASLKVLLYVLALVGGGQGQAHVSLFGYVVYWVLLIPTVLVLAKWHFKRVKPTILNGLLLGSMTLLISFCIDGVVLAMGPSIEQSLDMFLSTYTDWRFWITGIEILGLTAFAGGEFDVADWQKKTV